MDKIIIDHYTKLAASFGHSGQMSMQDPIIRERETQFILHQLKVLLRQMGLAPEAAHVLDLGCGNGYLLEKIWQEICPGRMTGVEFVPALVHLASERKLPGVHITQGDMRKPLGLSADVVITERSIVNLLSWEEQKLALQNIAQALSPAGCYIMVESFHEGWVNMNIARRDIGLDEVSVSAHNRYLREACVPEMLKMRLREVSGVEPRHALSSYFFHSRVLQHTLKTTSPIILQFLSESQERVIGDFSPIQFRVFQKVAP